MSKNTIYSILALVLVIGIGLGVFAFVQNSESEVETESIQNTSQSSSSLESQNPNTVTSPEQDAGVSGSIDSNGLVEVFTEASLREFDGRGENQCYMAVDGTVYDVSNVPEFRNGSHTPSGGQVMCGTDGSTLINSSPHGKRVLSNLPVVGSLN